MRPRKSLGQHFLHDRSVIARIIDAVAPIPGERFVEIGPGRGALTVPLLEVLGSLDVVEIDRDLAAELERSLGGTGLRMHRADALAFDFRTLGAAPGTLRLAANLPYNISTPLLFHLLGHHNLFRDLHVMLQPRSRRAHDRGPRLAQLRAAHRGAGGAAASSGCSW